MIKLAVGIKRLYLAAGCTFGDHSELLLPVNFGLGTHGSVYFGSKPPNGLERFENSPEYVLLYEDPELNQIPYKISTEGPPRGSSFTEIVALKYYDVDEVLVERAFNNDHESLEKLFQIAKPDEHAVRNQVEHIAGLFALKIHPQVVYRVLSDGPFMCDPKLRYRQNLYSPSAENLEHVVLRDEGKDALAKLVGEWPIGDSEKTKLSITLLYWFSSACRERDLIPRFISLFIPLELALRNTSGPLNEDQLRKIDAIMVLVEGLQGDLAEQLRGKIEKLLPRALFSRFASAAQRYSYPGWEADVEAFRHFNKMRNELIHSGETKIALQVNEEVIIRLEDITARFISFTLFGNIDIFPSRYRP